MKTVKPLPRLSCGLALAALLSAACAARPSVEGAAPSPAATLSSPATTGPSPETTTPAGPATEVMAGKPGAVFMYAPKTAEEAVAAAELVRADIEIRPLIEQAQEEALQAIQVCREAAMKLKAAKLPPGVVRPTQADVDKLYKAAEEKSAQHQARIQKQCDRYEAFFKKYPDDWYQRHRYAWFLADNYLPDDAAEQWRRVIAQQPLFPYAYNNLGTLYNHMGRDLEAIRLYRKAIELYPDDADFHVNLAVNYSTHRAEASKEFGWDLPRVFHECILSYQRARALRPKDPEIARDLASQYVLAKFFNVPNTADDAIEAWKYYLALQLTPLQRAMADRNLATICLRQKKDPAAAQKLLEEALTLAPDDPSLKVILEQCKAALQKTPQAE